MDNPTNPPEPTPPVGSALAALPVLLIALLPAAGTAETDYDGWMGQALQAVDESPQATLHERGVAASELAVEEARLQAPWRTSTVLEANGRQPRSNLVEGQFHDPFDLALTEEVTLEQRSSLQASLQASTQLDFLQQQVRNERLAFPFSASAEVSIDVIRGGEDGLGYTRQEADVLAAEGQRAETDRQWLESRLQFIQLVGDLFVAECTVQILEQTVGQVAGEAEEAEVRLKSDAIERTDYLNFVDLQNQLNQRVERTRSRRASLRARLSQWGPKAAGLADRLQGETLSCNPKIDALFARIDGELLDEEQLDGLVGQLPDSRSARLQLEQLQTQVRLQELTNRASLRPFIGAGAGHQPLADLADESIWMVSGGLRLTWGLPFRQGLAALETARAETETARSRVATTRQTLRASLRNLQARIRAQRDVLKVLRQSLETSANLLKVLKAKESIGSIDSLNYTNAYINRINALTTVYDSWGILQNALWQLREYRRWAEDR